jgi:hypothetical protein
LCMGRVVALNGEDADFFLCLGQLFSLLCENQNKSGTRRVPEL